MFTQCPDCDTAFRVTAEVLKQAAGMVRCGRCGHAFNALEYLTETKPKAKATALGGPDKDVKVLQWYISLGQPQVDED